MAVSFEREHAPQCFFARGPELFGLLFVRGEFEIAALVCLGDGFDHADVFLHAGFGAAEFEEHGRDFFPGFPRGAGAVDDAHLVDI